MATEVVSTIRSSGGDYSTLSGWESGEQTNLVTADEIAVAEMYDDWVSGLSDQAAIAGWTTDSTRYVEVRAATGEGFEGDITSGALFAKSVAYSYILSIQQDYTNVKNLRFNPSGTNCRAVDLNAKCVVDSCLSDGADATGFYGIYTDALAINCLAINGGNGFSGANWQVGEIYNCVSSGNTTGFLGVANGSYTLLKNCVSYGDTTPYSSNFNSSCSNNASDDYSGATPPGSSPYTSDVVSGDFLDAANDDYHIDTDSGLYEAGADLSSDFTTDVDGDTWASTWSIGFDQPSAGATDYQLDVTAGTLSLTGGTVSATVDKVLQITAAALSLSGGTITLTYGVSYQLDVTAGALSLAGGTATLTTDRALQVSPASFGLTGGTVSLDYATAGAYTLDVLPAALSLTGQSISVTRDLALQASAGALSLAGQTITMTEAVPGSYELEVAAGALNLAGGTITATYDGALTLADVYAKILEIHKILGLDDAAPMTVTPTSRVAGTISQTISGDGITSTTVTRDP